MGVFHLHVTGSRTQRRDTGGSDARNSDSVGLYRLRDGKYASDTVRNAVFESVIGPAFEIAENRRLFCEDNTQSR